MIALHHLVARFYLFFSFFFYFLPSFLHLLNCLYLNPQVFLASGLLILSPILRVKGGVVSKQLVGAELLAGINPPHQSEPLLIQLRFLLLILLSCITANSLALSC